MLRILLAGVLTLAHSGCAQGPTSTAVAIVAPTGQRICGAVALGPHLLVTAYHCVKGTTVQYAGPDEWQNTVGRVYRARLAKTAPSRDLAWLTTEGPPLPYRKARGARAGELVRVIVPLLDWTWSDQGQVLGEQEARADLDVLALKLDDRPGAQFLVTDLSIAPGWSGSPVVGSDGAVIGVVTACLGSVRWAGLVRHKACRPGLAFVSPLR